MRAFSGVLILALLCVGCTSKSMKKTARKSTSVITEAEIEQSTATNAFELIQQLRPHLLQRQNRSQSVSLTPGAPSAVVYLDGVRYGNLESLRNISSFSISEIEYLSPREATFRFGTDHNAGAFMIKSK